MSAISAMSCPFFTCAFSKIPSPRRTMRPLIGDSMTCWRSRGAYAITLPLPLTVCCHGAMATNTDPTTSIANSTLPTRRANRDDRASRSEGIAVSL
jgi:hypothetical protein